MLKICQHCGREFHGHPSALNCSIACQQRAKHARRKQREHSNYKPIPPESPYQLIFDNIDAGMLALIYADIQVHVYPKDIRINGPLPPNVPRPPDIHLVNGGDHHLVYHASRELLLG
jgi:hypothetical protein